MTTRMTTPSYSPPWILKEDVSLLGAILACGLTFNGPGLPGLRSELATIHQKFIKTCERLGVDGNRRTPTSFDARLKLLRRDFGMGELTCSPGEGNTLRAYRYHMLKKLFVRSTTSPSQAVSSSELYTPKARQTVLRKQEDRVSHGDRPATTREIARGRIEKRQKADVRKLLHALRSIHKQNTDVKVKREENLRKQRQIDQSEREWKTEAFHSLLQTSSASDDDCYPDFLKTLEDMKADDTKLNMVREENLCQQMEIERKMRDKERRTFQDLLKRFT